VFNRTARFLSARQSFRKERVLAGSRTEEKSTADEAYLVARVHVRTGTQLVGPIADGRFGHIRSSDSWILFLRGLAYLSLRADGAVLGRSTRCQPGAASGSKEMPSIMRSALAPDLPGTILLSVLPLITDRHNFTGALAGNSRARSEQTVFR